MRAHPSAVVILLPGSNETASRDADHAAQRIRERLARVHEDYERPARTRPVLVDLEKYK